MSDFNGLVVDVQDLLGIGWSGAQQSGALGSIGWQE
jgi:hypothetical protein